MGISQKDIHNYYRHCRITRRSIQVKISRKSGFLYTQISEIFIIYSNKAKFCVTGNLFVFKRSILAHFVAKGEVLSFPASHI